MSASYKRYNDLGSTAAEKAREKVIQEQMLSAQQKILEQQHLLEQQQKQLDLQKKQLARSSAYAQQEAQARAVNSRGSRGGNTTSAATVYEGSYAPEVTTREQKNKMIWSNEICVFKISAPWCKPCVEIAPKYNALAKLVNKPGKIMLFAEEYDKTNPNKLSANVQSIPAFDFWFRGKKVHRMVGADFEQVQRNVRMMMTNAKNGENGNAEKMQMEQEPPHPADGMQSKNRRAHSNNGMYPPSAMRM
jgi:thiol-disulfide isomerase/thioredoxin